MEVFAKHLHFAEYLLQKIKVVFPYKINGAGGFVNKRRNEGK